jgi:hypothetical protein
MSGVSFHQLSKDVMLHLRVTMHVDRHLFWLLPDQRGVRWSLFHDP